MPPVASREVYRCDFCSLVQFRTASSLCRRCHKPLEAEEEPEPTPVAPVTVVPRTHEISHAESAVALRIREIRSQRNMSQRQLAAKMAVPRTYISKVENGRATPTLASLERLAAAFSVHVSDLLQETSKERQQEMAALMADPFLAEIRGWLYKLDALQRATLLNHVREMALGQRKTA
jgi:transcriptional regulator with XRE-family HTH domain